MVDNALIIAIKRAQEGDTRAFDTLVRQFQNPAVAYARTLLRDPAAAEDVAQEAFVQAWRDLPRLAETAAFGAWLRRIVFKFCDRIRRSARPALPLDNALALRGHPKASGTFLVGEYPVIGDVIRHGFPRRVLFSNVRLNEYSIKDGWVSTQKQRQKLLPLRAKA